MVDLPDYLGQVSESKNKAAQTKPKSTKLAKQKEDTAIEGKDEGKNENNEK